MSDTAIEALRYSEFPNSSDCISRQAAIDALDEQITQCDKALGSFDISMKDEYAVKVERASLKAYRETLNVLPSAQPEHTNSCYTNSWCIDCKEYDTENKCCPRYNRVIKQTLDDAYRHGETEAEARFHAQQRWIPCSERLPENGHYYLWCSDMGSVQSDYYWDGFENGMKYGYNIVAWMPLPEPYRKEGD